jgi:RNA polymerase sigma-70 factor (ECF subfamily)
LTGREINIETALLKGLKKSDHECFQQLFAKYSQPLYRFSLSYLKSTDAAEDVVQEVFMKIWRKRKEIDTGKSFQSYLFTIALNVIRKQFNKLSVSNQLKHDLLISFAENKETFDEKDDFQEMVDKLETLIRKMPERRRKIFRLKKFEGKSQKEIAEEFDITTKTVEYHITEAMKFLKQEFEKLRMKGMIFFCLFVKNK